jgi:hypothetical protein
MKQLAPGNARGTNKEWVAMGFLSWLGSILPPQDEKSPEEPGWLRKWVIPTGQRDDPEFDEIQRAAVEDVAAMEEERHEYFDPEGPGNQKDAL